MKRSNLVILTVLGTVGGLLRVNPKFCVNTI